MLKRSRYIILIALTIFSLIGCEYDDFVENEFEYTAVYFGKQAMSRTIVSDEWMQVGVGVMLGGRLENNTNEYATIELTDNLLDSSYITLPASYFTLVDEDGNATNNIKIPAGSNQGFIYVKFTEAFLDDSLALTYNYALGFTITSTSLDSILPEMNYTVVSFKYVNTYFGYYYREGETTIYSNGNSAADTTITYDRNTDGNSAWELLTVSNNIVNTNWSNASGIVPRMNFTVETDNSVSILGLNAIDTASTPGNILSIVDDGNNTYNSETRMFKVNYSYTFIDHQGMEKKFVVRDELKFRNRVIDGVNQWFED